MNDANVSEEIRLLREIKDLLLIVADPLREDYERRQAQREQQRLDSIRELVNSSSKRRTAWDLADGTVGQGDIAKRAGMDTGYISRYFKSLRELGAVSGDPPKRTVDVPKAAS